MASRPSTILTAVLLGVALLGAAFCSGCAVDRETTLSRTARQRKIRALVTARERLEHEREVLLRQTREMRAEIGDARAESVSVAAELRATRSSLGQELGRLQILEQDLVAAQTRAGEIEQELQPLRALEQTLRDHEQLRAAAEKRSEDLKKELAAVEAATAKTTAELQPKIDELKQKLQHAQELAKAVAAADAALEAAAKVIVPPPAKEPEPAKEPSPPKK